MRGDNQDERAASIRMRVHRGRAGGGRDEPARRQSTLVARFRPNLHIQDYCDAVQLFLTVPADKIQNETFNAGYQNLSLMEIAELVRRVVGEEMPDRKAVDIVTTPTDDVRSYHINSDKIKRVLGYQPQHTIEDAVRELCQAFLARKLPNSMEDDRYYNVRLLKRLKAA